MATDQREVRVVRGIVVTLVFGVPLFIGAVMAASALLAVFISGWIPSNWFSTNAADWLFGGGVAGDAANYFRFMVGAVIAGVSWTAIQWGFGGTQTSRPVPVDSSPAVEAVGHGWLISLSPTQPSGNGEAMVHSEGIGVATGHRRFHFNWASIRRFDLELSNATGTVPSGLSLLMDCNPSAGGYGIVIQSSDLQAWLDALTSRGIPRERTSLTLGAGTSRAPGGESPWQATEKKATEGTILSRVTASPDWIIASREDTFGPFRGQVLAGRYQLENEIAGYEGEHLFRARDITLDRWVFVKLIPQSEADRPDKSLADQLGEIFERESLRDVGTESGFRFLVADFPLGLSGPRRPPPRATRASWHWTPMSDAIAITPTPRTWSAEEWQQIHHGAIPPEMEFKWFAFVEDEALHMARSWTGYETHRAAFDVSANGTAVITEAWVNGDPELGIADDLDNEGIYLECLIEHIILGRGADLRRTGPFSSHFDTMLRDKRRTYGYDSLA